MLEYLECMCFIWRYLENNGVPKRENDVVPKRDSTYHIILTDGQPILVQDQFKYPGSSLR